MGATEIARAVRCKRGNVYKALKAAGLNKAGRSSGGSEVMTRGPGSLWHNKEQSELALFWLANEIRPHPFP